MPRANSSVPRHRRHRKLIKQAKGYFGTRKSNFRTAKDAVQKGLQYAYRDRRNKKRTFRSLWIARINAAVRQHGMSYSKFIVQEIYQIKPNYIFFNMAMALFLSIMIFTILHGIKFIVIGT